jgi:hypothetical protein
MTSPRRAAPRLLVGLFASVMLVVTGCGGDDDEGAEPPDHAVSQTAPASDAGFTFGNELVLGADGPNDEILVANVQLDIVVRNETGAPQTLRFTNGALDDGRTEVGPIPDGGEERWRATSTVTRQWELVGDPDYHGTLATDPGTFGDPDVADTES